MNSVRRERSTSSAEGSQSFSGAAPLTPWPRRRRPSPARVELVRVVRAEQPHLFAVAGDQLAQPLLVGQALAPVGVVEVLEEAQARRAGGRSGELVVVEVGVAAVQQPALAAS